MTITQTVEIPDNRWLNIKVPYEVPTGSTIITFTPVETEKEQKRVRGCAKGQFHMAEDFDEPLVGQEKVPVFGCAKGRFRMADDFDEPLEDFKDYM